MNYNIDAALWADYLKANPNEKLLIKDGAIWSAPDGTIGQFSTTKEAIKTLKDAGYPDSLIENRDK